MLYVICVSLWLFVNMRQKHVILSTHLGATSNQQTGVCASGRGRPVLLRKCRWTRLLIKGASVDSIIGSRMMVTEAAAAERSQ